MWCNRKEKRKKKCRKKKTNWNFVGTVVLYSRRFRTIEWVAPSVCRRLYRRPLPGTDGLWRATRRRRTFAGRVLPRYTSITVISRRPRRRPGRRRRRQRPNGVRASSAYHDLSVRRQTRSGPTVDHTRPVRCCCRRRCCRRRRRRRRRLVIYSPVRPSVRSHVISSFDCARVCLHVFFLSRTRPDSWCAAVPCNAVGYPSGPISPREPSRTARAPAGPSEACRPPPARPGNRSAFVVSAAATAAAAPRHYTPRRVRVSIARRRRCRRTAVTVVRYRTQPLSS